VGCDNVSDGGGEGACLAVPSAAMSYRPDLNGTKIPPRSEHKSIHQWRGHTHCGGTVVDLSTQLDTRSDRRGVDAFDGVFEDAVIAFLFFVEVAWVVQLARWASAIASYF
jgi:hypothetical protein